MSGYDLIYYNGWKIEATKGTGLGLYIFKEIITKHYGDLELVESQKDAELG